MTIRTIKAKHVAYSVRPLAVRGWGWFAISRSRVTNQSKALADGELFVDIADRKGCTVKFFGWTFGCYVQRNGHAQSIGRPTAEYALASPSEQTR